MDNPKIVLEVHFDFKKEGTRLYCGYVFLEEGETIDSGLVEYDLSKRLRLEEQNKILNSKFKCSNNFHYSLTSYLVAIEQVKVFLCENDDYDNVLYRNQNEIIFKWVNNPEKVDKTYSKVINHIKDEFHKVQLLVGRQVTHSASKIGSTKNEAKKALTKLMKVYSNEPEIIPININEFGIVPDFEKYKDEVLNLRGDQN